MDFKVNDFLTIKDFKRLGVFEEHMKWGKPFTYEKFTGTVEDSAVTGLICLFDDNIYNLRELSL